MSKLLILVLSLCIAGAVIWIVFGSKPKRIDVSFASGASIKCQIHGKTVDAVIKDTNDIKTLKAVFAESAYTTENPACMFAPEVSVTLTDGRKSITFCPAFDGHPYAAIDKTRDLLYMPDKQQKALHRICKKYGVAFPL